MKPIQIKIYNIEHKCSAFIEPIFFPKESGLQWRVVGSGSFFASKKTHFEFDLKGKIIVFFIETWYCLKMNLWRKLRHQWPHRIGKL